MNSSKSIIDILDLEKGIVLSNASTDLSVEKHHYVKEVQAKELDVDSIYFSGDIPTIYIKQVKTFDTPTIQNIAIIQKKIWNQGKVPFLYVENDTEIRIYNCFTTPVRYDKTEEEINQQIQLASASKVSNKDLKELVSVFDKISIETGSFWKEKKYASKIDNQLRVNKTLISNFQKAQQQLKKAGLTNDIIHNLLLRSLFLLYLEDRGATTQTFYQKFDAKATSYFSILENKEYTYKLYKKLDFHFNGNLNLVTKNEQELVTENHLRIIKQCFWSEINDSFQLKLFDWKIFDFSIIPIELISEIYENFLVEQAQDGAFYTPNILVDFILNKVLPYPSKNDHAYHKKILDPTCGSGIFLVQSLNRLLDRWCFANPKKTLDFDTIKKITLDNIFGIEYNPEAIKVAAFSIYLAMLNRLEPKTLWEKIKFPYLIYDPKNSNNDATQGNNLFYMSSLGKGPFENIDFDLVVGNPPFKREGLDEDAQQYLTERNYAQEYSMAFLDRATTLCPNGKIALISTSKILFNSGKGEGDKKFREFLFQKTYVEEVYNFSIFRTVPKKAGNSLFASAIGPACILFYSKNIPKNASNTILYCAPKTYLKNRIADGIVIDNIDIKYLPREICQEEDSKIWKIAMWGMQRDFSFITQLKRNSILENWFEKNHCEKGVGFRYPTETTKHPKTSFNIKNLPFIDAKKLDRFFTSKYSTISIEKTEFNSLGCESAFATPHVLIKGGQKNKKLCASYLDFECSFNDSIYGIYHSNAATLKILTSFLNSSLVVYYLFLTSSSWGIDRPRVKPYELLDLPDLLSNISPEITSVIIQIFDKIIQLKKSNELYSLEDIDTLEKEIDYALMDALTFSKEEKILIEDMIDLTLDAFSNKEKSIAYNRCTKSELEKYAKYITKTLSDFLGTENDSNIWVSTHTSNALNIICLHFNSEHKYGAILEIKDDASLLRELENYSYSEFSQSIYYRKVIKYYKDDKIYIVKPNEKRFWSRSMALNDADEVIAELINAES